MYELIYLDRCRTIHQLSHMVGASYEVCLEIRKKETSIRGIPAKLAPIPPLLNLDQKRWRLDVCLEFCEMVNEDSQLSSAESSWAMKFGF